MKKKLPKKFVEKIRRQKNFKIHQKKSPKNRYENQFLEAPLVRKGTVSLARLFSVGKSCQTRFVKLINQKAALKYAQNLFSPTISEWNYQFWFTVPAR